AWTPSRTGRTSKISGAKGSRPGKSGTAEPPGLTARRRRGRSAGSAGQLSPRSSPDVWEFRSRAEFCRSASEVRRPFARDVHLPATSVHDLRAFAPARTFAHFRSNDHSIEGDST